MASNILTKQDYTKTSLRAYFLQNGFNYGNYQGIGYANMLFPALRKMYKDDDDALQEALKENVEFFNTNIHLVTFIANLHLVMLENGQSNKEIRNIKMALMGPLAGIGDSLSQFILAPLFGTIGASMAADGMMMGPWFYWLGMNITLFIIKILFGSLGHKMGTSVVASLSEKMAVVTNIAGMIGVTVISATAVKSVKLKTILEYSMQATAEEVKTITLQSMIDGIAPCLLPVLYIGLMYYLIKEKKWTTYKLIGLTLVIALVGSVIGFIG